jgi:hypothetical protein
LTTVSRTVTSANMKMSASAGWGISYPGFPTVVFRTVSAAQRMYAGPIGVSIISGGVTYVYRLVANQNISLRTRSFGYGAVHRTITGAIIKLYASPPTWIRRVPRTVSGFGISMSAVATRSVTFHRTVVARMFHIVRSVRGFRAVPRTVTGANMKLSASAIPNIIRKRSIIDQNISLSAIATRTANKYRTVTGEATMTLSASAAGIVRRAGARLRILLRMRGEQK